MSCKLLPKEPPFCPAQSGASHLPPSLANLPYTLETLVANGTSYPHLRFGTGPRHLVIIPGLSLKSVLDTPDFVVKAFADFAPHFTLHLFARCQVLPPGFTLPDFAQDLADCLQAAHIPAADLFGASLGGIVAMNLALLRPDLVHSLALASTTPLLDAPTADRFQSLATLAETAQTASLVHTLASLVYSPDFLRKIRLAFDGLVLALTPAELAHFVQVTRTFRPFDLTPRLPQIRCPVFVAAAEGDRFAAIEWRRKSNGMPGLGRPARGGGKGAEGAERGFRCSRR